MANGVAEKRAFQTKTRSKAKLARERGRVRPRALRGRATNGAAAKSSGTGRTEKPRRQRIASEVDIAGSGKLGKYLQDHFAGSRAGLELARQLAADDKDGELAHVLGSLIDEIEIDRGLLKQAMEILHVPFGPVKQATAWLGGKFVRLKPGTANGHGSALTRLLELESLSLGVEGKAMLWRALIELEDRVPQLAAIELESALDRAQDQRDLLEKFRLQAVRALSP